MKLRFISKGSRLFYSFHLVMCIPNTTLKSPVIMSEVLRLWIHFFSLHRAAVAWHILHGFFFISLMSKCFSSSIVWVIPVLQIRKTKLRMFKQVFHNLKKEMLPSMEQNSQSYTSFPKPRFLQLILIFNSVHCNTGLIPLVTNLKISN